MLEGDQRFFTRKIDYTGGIDNGIKSDGENGEFTTYWHYQFRLTHNTVSGERKATGRQECIQQCHRFCVFIFIMDRKSHRRQLNKCRNYVNDWH